MATVMSSPAGGAPLDQPAPPAGVIRPTEAECQRTIMLAARQWGWRRYHHRPARDEHGRVRTALEGDAGFPDLILVHPERGRLIVAELKRRPNKPTVEQTLWIDALKAAGVDARTVWVPEEQDAFVLELIEIGRGRQ